MARTRTVYSCTACGARSPKWAGQCPECGEWNTLEEVAEAPASPRAAAGAPPTESRVVTLAEVGADATARFDSGLAELDRVLGGGVVPGAAVLIGGDPGIGKSTLLLQSSAYLAARQAVLYVTGEESLSQVALRAERLGVATESLGVVAETCVESILAHARERRPRVLVVDSVQTVFTETLQSAPGAVAQVRESAARLIRFAKETDTTLFLVGHVTKEGQLAGPRVLEHMVDTVLYFESEGGSRFRLLRAVKNRFGA
ncbi:MAG: DNA repair protein RadA, partial [Ectothiorhodospiraceae bacterium]